MLPPKRRLTRTFLSLAILSAACAKPGSDSASSSLAAGAAPISFGATSAQALAGGTSSFVLEATPDLALHAALPATQYAGQRLTVRGLDPEGHTVWNYPHLYASSFDVILPVFGSEAGRKRISGTYTFEVTAPDGAVLAKGQATLTSSGANRNP
jgi:hypothetical protein